MTTERDDLISQPKTNPGIGEVTITVRDRFQRYDKIQFLRILVGNPAKIHLTLQCLTGLGSGTRVRIYPTKRNSHLLTTVTSPTWFDLLQQTMKLTDYRDYAL